MAEWTKAGAGGAVVMGSNPAQPMNFKISEFFWQASYQYSRHKISSTGTV